LDAHVLSSPEPRITTNGLAVFAPLPASARYRNGGTNGRACVQNRLTLFGVSVHNNFVCSYLRGWTVSELRLRSGADSRENRQESGDFGPSSVNILTAELQYWGFNEVRLQDRQGAGFL
jgi:hypothetical protein